jgi:multidrug efflux pump
MVPIGSMVKISQTYGPDPVLRYSGYPAADFIGEANPAMLSSAQAMGTMAELARMVLPNGMTIEWTDLSFQEATQATPPCWCSRCRFCLPSWCWQRPMRAGCSHSR